MVHEIRDTRTADDIEASDDTTIVVSTAAFDSFALDVSDGVVIVTSDGCSFIGEVADVDDDEVLIELH